MQKPDIAGNSTDPLLFKWYPDQVQSHYWSFLSCKGTKIQEEAECVLISPLYHIDIGPPQHKIVLALPSKHEKLFEKNNMETPN